MIHSRFQNLAIMTALAVLTCIAAATHAQAMARRGISVPRGFPIDFDCHLFGFKQGFEDCALQVRLGHYSGHPWQEDWPHHLAIQCNGRPQYEGPLEILAPEDVPGAEALPGQALLMGINPPNPILIVDIPIDPGSTEATTDAWLRLGRARLEGECRSISEGFSRSPR